MKLREFKKKTNEDAAGVGKITKQNTTVDVKPGETARQAAKFGNKVDKNGRPPELHKKARKNSNPHVLTNLGLGEAISTVGLTKDDKLGINFSNFNQTSGEKIGQVDVKELSD